MSPTAHDLIIRTDDGPELEAELTLSDRATPRAGIVLCHPHPQYGGTMRSLVISVLFAELSAAGFACLRFNFRGVEASTGTYSHGEGEQLDVLAAVATMADAVAELPIALVGWSFGADVSLTVVDPRVAGWVAIAPPLRFRPTFGAASDVRPKHLVLAANDEFRARRPRGSSGGLDRDDRRDRSRRESLLRRSDRPPRHRDAGRYRPSRNTVKV